jgi:hypothetical protein
MTSKKDKNAALLETALDRFEQGSEYFGTEYDRGHADVEFALGNQWPEEIRNERGFDGRPCLTENRTLAFVHQVVNQIRQTRPAIRTKPVDDKADVEISKILDGHIRNIETQSS